MIGSLGKSGSGSYNLYSGMRSGRTLNWTLVQTVRYIHFVTLGVMVEMGYGLQASSYLVVTVISEMSPLTKKRKCLKILQWEGT